MNLPNILTTSRIFLTILFLIFIFQPSLQTKIIAASIFILGSLTDWYDGYYARKHKLITNYGKIMDPIADKFLVLSAFFAFTKMGIMASWMFGLIAFREILITILRLLCMKKGTVLAAESAGKVKTVLQIVTILVILFFLVYRASTWQMSTNLEIGWLKGINVLMFLAVGITFYSGAAFLWNNRKVKYV